jgi:hypothetical protein
MAERFVARFNLDAGQKPIAECYEAMQKHGLQRIDSAQAHDNLRNALARALRWDAQAKMGMPMDRYPRSVKVTLILEPVDDPKMPVRFGEAAVTS